MNPTLSASAATTELGALVAANSRVAPVLERFGLDYCCHGHQTLGEAAHQQGVAVEDVLRAIETAGAPSAGERDLDTWQDLGALAEHIVNTHHHYVREICPTLRAWLDKLVARHGDRHQELAKIRQTFMAVSDEMAAHMIKEENILFPYVAELAGAKRTGTRLPGSPFGTVVNPIRVMEDDHQVVGGLVEEIRRLTGDYQPPADGCTTYQLCFAELQRFEADLHRHVHLENNILFPGAVELEQTLA